MRIRWLAWGFLVIIVLNYQNCAEVSFGVDPEDPSKVSSSSSQSSTTPPTDPVIQSVDTLQTVQVEMSIPKDFALEIPKELKNYLLQFSLHKTERLTTLRTEHGTVMLMDDKKMSLQFNPDFGFRGIDKVIVYVSDDMKHSAKVVVTFSIGNSLAAFQPALAVRATACITCHAQVNSSMVTDFGFKGDGLGNDYYFGKQKTNKLLWNTGEVYGDYATGTTLPEDGLHPSRIGSWATLNINALTSKVYAAKAPVPAEVLQVVTGVPMLANYLRNRLAGSYYKGAKATEVIEKDQIYIGAPTADRLRKAFAVKAKDLQIVYYPESQTALPLLGLSPSANSFVTNSGEVSCEGDVFIDGTVYLNKLKLITRTGCRLYVTGVVSIAGPIVYVNEGPSTNLQITSSKAILMGLGDVFKNGALCETKKGEWYFDFAKDPKEFASQASSLNLRLRDLFTVPTVYTRAGLNPVAFQNSILAEVAKLGPRLDAACEPTGRAVSFRHILLNAPIVQSRYNGDVIGTIIAEFALMSLGNFKFEYDPLFSKVAILPFLSQSDFLVIK